MNVIVLGIIIFASLAVVLQSVSAAGRVEASTHNGIRFALIGLAWSAFYTLVAAIVTFEIPVQALICVLIAISIYLSVDRRGHRRA